MNISLEDPLTFGEDFWASLQSNPDLGIFDVYKDKSDSLLDHSTHNSTLRIQTKLYQARYHTVIFNENLSSTRDSSQVAPLDIPGYVVGARCSQSFSEALKLHVAVHDRLNELGY